MKFIDLFWRDGRLFFLGVQTSLIWLKCLCEMMLEDDGFFFWWNVGKLLRVNETTSLTLECRAFTVRFSIRDRSSLRQRMTTYLCSSHLEVEILNHVDLTPRFLDGGNFAIRSSFQNVVTEHLFCLPSNSASNQTRKNDVTMFFFHDGNHMNHKNDYF